MARKDTAPKDRPKNEHIRDDCKRDPFIKCQMNRRDGEFYGNFFFFLLWELM